MSADKRADYILMHSNEGNLNLTDSIENPGIRIAIANAYNFLNAEIQRYEFIKDSILTKAKKDSTLYQTIDKLIDLTFEGLTEAQKDSIRKNPNPPNTNYCYKGQYINGYCVTAKQRIEYTNHKTTYVEGTASKPGYTYNNIE